VGSSLSEPNQQSFYEAVTEGQGCLLIKGLMHECSSSVLDAHHIITKRRIRAPTSPIPTDLMDLACADPRNGIPLCRYHHDKLESGEIDLRWRKSQWPNQGEIPEWVVDEVDFAFDWGLESYLPWWLGSGVDAEEAGFR